MHLLNMKNKITLIIISSALISFPAVSFAITCYYSDTGFSLTAIGGTCPAGTSPNKPAQSQAQSIPSNTSGQTGGGTSIFPAPTQTQTSGKTGTQIISLPNPLGSVKTIPELIGRLVDWLIFIASIAILPAMIVWGAYQLLTAGGNPDAVTSARHTITWAVVGYALLLISKGIEFIIRDVLTRGS